MKKVIAGTLAALSLTTAVATAAEPVEWYSHASKLKFSGLTYIGLTTKDFKENTPTPKADETNFEIRRAYFQVKAYLLDDPESYYRVTFDMHQNGEDDMVIRAKYAYLYYNNILPATGVEVGLAHRPWHDYEEHNAWYFRDISKVMLEADNAADLSNSADFGIMTKTKTKYFDADIGVFNGEGYHSDFNDDQGTAEAGNGMSIEWRATAHILGVNGKDKQGTKTYFDASFFGQYNMAHKTNVAAPSGYDDLIFAGLHTVYNQPEFLLSAQYIASLDTADNDAYVSTQAGSGYSVNGEFRLGDTKQYRLLGRYDSWTPETLGGTLDKEQASYIAGVAWDQSKNVQWVINTVIHDNEVGSVLENENGSAYMLTAQVEF